MAFKIVFVEPVTIGKKVYAPGATLNDCGGTPTVFRNHDSAWVKGKWRTHDWEGVPMRAMKIIKER